MPQTIKPATPLPWTQSNQIGGNGDRFIISADAERYPVSRAEPKDAAYIVHAANSYPRLVEALRELHAIDERKLAASERRTYKIGHSKIQERVERNRAILRELGGE